jgi:hypothetical protein
LHILWFKKLWVYSPWSFISENFVLFCLWDPRSPHWPWTQNLASVSWVLGLQECTPCLTMRIFW